MAAQVDGYPSSTTSPVSLLLKQVIDLADDADLHEIAGDGDDNALVQKLLRRYFREDVGRLDSSSMVEASCGQAWDWISGKTGRPSDAWTSMVVTSLFLLTARDCVEELVMQMWRMVANPAEERHAGLGRFIMRRVATAAAREHPASKPALMNFAIATLRGKGHPPAPSSQQLSTASGCGDGRLKEVERVVPQPSKCGLQLALDVASRSLETCLEQDKGVEVTTEGVGAGVFETWRWDIHHEVVNMLRACRLENLNQLVLMIARPLYRGWSNARALQDVWSLMGGENVELHLALLCILAEDLRPIVVDVEIPKMFDLIYAGVSSESSLCRRRGLHVLRQVLAWAAADTDEGSATVGELEGDGTKSTATQDPSPPRSGQLFFSTRDALVQWQDFARCLEVLCEETELHLLDQVVPTVERLCSKLSPPLPHPQRPIAPLATEFRWVAIPLGMLIRSGTFARRRRLLHRVVKRELGLGKGDAGEGGGHAVTGTAALSHMEEAWVARVLLPALDHVGWHSSSSSSARGKGLDDFAGSVTGFLRLYVSSLPVPRVTKLLSLLLQVIRDHSVVSTGGLCAILDAFDDDEHREVVGGILRGGRGNGATEIDGRRHRPRPVPAMGREELFQLKETLLVVLPPLNQAKRVLFLDKIVRVLLNFTDYGALGLSSSDSSSTSSLPSPSPSYSPSLGLVTSVLSAMPLDLVRDRYLSPLATWVAHFPLDPGGTERDEDDTAKPWLLLFTRRVEIFLGRRRRGGRQPGAERGKSAAEPGIFERGGSGGSELSCGGIAEGRNICLLGLVLSEAFALREDRHEVLAAGLSPLVRLLRQCWHEPYVAPETVRRALALFGAWAEVSEAEGLRGNGEEQQQQQEEEEGKEASRWWRWVPMEAAVNEVVTLVTARLGSMVGEVGTSSAPPYYSCSSKENGGTSGGGHDQGGDEGEGDTAGRDAQVLLLALDAAAAAITPCSSSSSSSVLRSRRRRPALHAAAAAGSSAQPHPGVIELGDKCVSLLLSCGRGEEGGGGGGGGDRPAPPPTAHLLAIAALEIVVRDRYRHQDRARARGRAGGATVTATAARLLPPGQWDQSRCELIVLSLLQNKVEGRITSGNASSAGKGSNSEWGNILKQHERRKWSCLCSFLPVALAGSNRIGERASLRVCDALVEGIRTSSRGEMPLAMACFRQVFPEYVRTLPEDDRAAGFTSVFETVFAVFKEAHRPQLPLVRDFVSAVLHPTLLAMMPDPKGGVATAAVTATAVKKAFSDILEFGSTHNKPSVLRAVVGSLVVHGRQSPGSMLPLVPGIVGLLLFKSWGQGIETLSNGEDTSASAEAPRFVLLLFIETSLIPAAAKGDQGCRGLLHALTLHLMDLLASKEFRQSSITDQVIYGRRLRAWQALCVLCGYLCAPAASPNANSDALKEEVVLAMSAWFWPVHGRTALPPVRQLMEVFAVRMCRTYPDLFLVAATRELKDFRLPGQVLCSLLIVSGHTLLGKKGINLSKHHRVELFKACLPWVVGTHVMGRLIAQFVCYSVLPDCAADVDGTHLETLFLFLRDNPEMNKMRQRQLEAFERTDCSALCTVVGMLETHGTGSTGDIIPVHMCELLKETMGEIWNEALKDKTQTLEEGRAWLQTAAAVKSGAWFEEEERGEAGGPGNPTDRGSGDIAPVDSHIQQKIIPWDKLDLEVESASSASLEQSTAAGRVRQPVVMCASLVDKLPNLAGLARTSEIFAASKLTLPDARVVKNPAFTKISTGAEQWLPIEEVGEKDLVPWLRRAKRHGGHVLVGVEQTNNSVCLTKMKFSKDLRYTLVLGRENSGLPLEVINEMDVCCQIPQQGVLRSLNAHVSGAIILAEYSRQMMMSSSAPASSISC